MKKILFNRQSECIQPLKQLIEKQKHRTLALWALKSTYPLLEMLEGKYPYEKRPNKAVELGELWLKGEIKMPIAKKAILECHQVAKEISDDAVYVAIVHAIGQAVSTVHVETHALGLIFYHLTAIYYLFDDETKDYSIKKTLDKYYNDLLYYEENADKINQKWAKFLLDETKPNKEKILNEKQINGLFS